ncbi:MAG: transcriptional repressor [Desulfofustis sp. PB-SRB1]|jgi:Fur family ferric uptake transcriptional regulator|nr:transcriptional repressor [Desulfofustis sp. PB-SRB1]MBM1001480.1 transcriptional repressor [Desulfofustis sp. PB-SRB1]HBH28169.1 transcriptional repressor [Desulfofustis sp.]HBH31360.1 transcriptional repressor [Desulfofustis sp.]
MCHQCDYEQLLVDADLEATANRMGVLELVGNNAYPLSADDLYTILKRSRSINRVTVYRILDLLVKHGVVERISTGGRAFYYDLAPNDYHQPHPHFYCRSCGRMDCLDPRSLAVDTDTLRKIYPGRIEKVEIRIDGLCTSCEKKTQN